MALFNRKTDKEKEESRKKRKDAFAKTFQTTTKQLIWLFSINGILWIWCSYALAFFGRDQIAESLSTQVCVVVIGQMAMYVISKTVENVFKYNNIGGHSNTDALLREGIGTDTQINEEVNSYGSEQYETSGDQPDEFTTGYPGEDGEVDPSELS